MDKKQMAELVDALYRILNDREASQMAHHGRNLLVGEEE
tara:strand:- start:3367 stop:3483 length:117 start_codon:yes stop_codon:yes gene_type:complete